MKWQLFAYGIVFGPWLGLLLTAGNIRLDRTFPESNLVNFGPAIVGFGIFTIEVLAAAIALIAGVVLLIRRRWRPPDLA